MKSSFSPKLFRLVFLTVFALAGLLAARPVCAGLTFTFEISHEVYRANPPFFTTNYQMLAYNFQPDSNLPTAPSGHYSISSPTGLLQEQFDLSSAGSSNFTGSGQASFSDYNSFSTELTGGNWTISVSNGTVTTYYFQMATAGFTSNSLGTVNVTFPVPGAVNVTNDPTFTWQGPANWGSSGDIQVEDYSGAFFEENFLSTSQTSWLSPSSLPSGQNTFIITYSSPYLSTIVASTPTNSLGQTISSWTFQPFVATYTVESFTVTNIAAPLTLATALNTSNLTWTTAGSSNWFPETNTTHDGVAAAQSGRISGTNTSVLQTTITGPGTLTFWWSTQTGVSDFDFDLEFQLDGVDWDDIDNITPWTQESTVSLGSGAHTLRWIAYSGDSLTDAGWVDQVQFTSNSGGGPVSVQLGLSIQRTLDFTGGQSGYYAYPDVSTITPAPITTNLVISPDGQMYSVLTAGNTTDASDTEEFFPTLDQAVNAMTNGQWTIYINQGDASQRVYNFSVSLNGLTTNLLSPVTILTPAPNAMNVASNTPLQWNGPTNASAIFVEAYQAQPSFVFDGYTDLASNATSWPSPPSMVTGTNYFYVEYLFYNFTNFSFTTPVDTNMNPIASWSPTIYLYDTATEVFSVRNPLAVQLTNTPPQTSGGNFQLGFQTVPGHTETVQMRTNLFSGVWVTVTNFTGDGSSYQLSVPVSNSPGKYFRVITQ